MFTLDETCHLFRCDSMDINDAEKQGCKEWEDDHDDLYTYKDQLIRDYPSFSQIRKMTNRNSKLYAYLSIRLDLS